MAWETLSTQSLGAGIQLLTLNRPDARNALSIRMRFEILEALEQFEGAKKVGALVISGSGETFCAGFDLKEFGRPDLMRDLFESSARYHRALWNFSKPVIAAINGPALGGGLDLATLCDIRICVPESRFGHPEIKFGGPPLFTPFRWIVGDGAARELCYTGRKFDAAEALRIGLVTEIVQAGSVVDRAKEIARGILEAPTQTLAFVKSYMNGNQGKDFEESFTVEHDEAFKKMLEKQ